jgi:ABC-type branched-subunit amino acid transport system substrate-binding protein
MRISKETIAILLLTWSVVSVVGVLRIASVIALSSDLAAPSTAMRDGELFWQEKINDRGGVLINGTRRLVEIISVDVGASTYEEVLQKVTDTAYQISNGTYGEIHAVFTPYTSVLTEAFMLVAEKSKIFSCSSCKLSSYILSRPNHI